MIDDLIQIIDQETHLFEDFLALLERQKEMLVANDTAGITEVTELQQLKLIESRKLNRKREELTAAIRKANAIEEDLTVSRLLDFADENQVERLLQLKAVILELNERITETRNTNAILLNQSREFISRTMSMLSDLSRPTATYTNGDRMPREAATVAVDRRI